MQSDDNEKVRDRIAEEAARWVARLQSSDATDIDRHEFEDWLSRDPSHRDAFEELKDLWSDLKSVPIPPSRLKKLETNRRTVMQGTAGLLAVALLSVSVHHMGLLDRWRADHYTLIGEVRSIRLDDGTLVDLNTDTALAVRYTPGERRIELLRGQAFFNVAKNPERPFVVHGEGLDATAVGTRYAVRTASGDFLGDVQVEEGRVDVRASGNRVSLSAGEVASLTARGQLDVSARDVSADTAWRSGQLVFSEKPLREVLATLELYRRGRILVLDEAAAEQRVSGVFDLNDTDQALQALEQNLSVRVTRLTNMMVIVRSR